MQVTWRNLTYLAIVLPAFLPLLACAVPAWREHRRRYLAGWRDWLPAMTVVAALMAVLDAYSVAQGWWAFDLRFFTPPVVRGVPLAELMFFLGAVFFIRFVVVAVDRLTRGRALYGPVVHRRRLVIIMAAVVLGSYSYGWASTAHPRTLMEFGFMYPLSTLILATTAGFRRRETWVGVVVALALLFVMDSVMNRVGAFTHTPGVGTGIGAFGLFPIEDIPYALTVIQLLIAAPHLWRQAGQQRRAEAPDPRAGGPPPRG